jgi:hypothetical protein
MVAAVTIRALCTARNVVMATGKLSARAPMRACHESMIVDDHETRHGDKVEWGMVGAEATSRHWAPAVGVDQPLKIQESEMLSVSETPSLSWGKAYFHSLNFVCSPVLSSAALADHRSSGTNMCLNPQMSMDAYLSTFSTSTIFTSSSISSSAPNPSLAYHCLPTK